MARPNKQGLDYFPMDVTTDDKFELIEAKHGMVGFGVIVKLYQKIYKEGYFIDWNEERLLIFKKAVNVDINSINVIINDAIKYKIFDEKLFIKFKILTSCGIQKRFLTACDRRKTVDLCRNYIIVDIADINVNINWINEDISTQSKEEKSKEGDSFKKTKDWMIKNCKQVTLMKEPFTEDQFENLKKDFTSEQIKDILLKMHNWKPLLQKNQSANLTFRNWARKETSGVKKEERKFTPQTKW